jgi:hypothetical protein
MPQQWCLDIRNAAAWLKDRSQNESFSFIGLRLGATLISNTEGLAGEQLILWDPAVSGERFLSQLAQYHRRALQDFVRYSKQRLAEPDQFYGFSIKESAMMALCKMKLKFTTQNSFRRTSLLTTKNYWSDETLNTSVPAKNETMVHQEVDDEVLWHWSQYTESAFSSANSYRWILKQLTGSKA